MMYTYDRNPTLDIAMVATDKLDDVAYVPLSEAPEGFRDVQLVYLRQMHFVANTSAHNLIAHTRLYDLKQWERGQKA